MTELPYDAKVFYSDADFTLGAWQNVVFVIWHAYGTVEVVERLVDQVESYYKKHSNPIGTIHLLHRTAKLPGNRARDVLARAMKRIPFVGAAIVQEGRGLRAATVRGFVAGLNLVARQGFPMKIFPTAPEACLWYTKTAKQATGVNLDTYKLTNVTNELMKLR